MAQLSSARFTRREKRVTSILLRCCMLTCFLTLTRIQAKPRTFLTRILSVRGGSMEPEYANGNASIAPSPHITVRFHLVRHGETIANDQGLVVGQWDSPLSERGIQQATALGKSDLMQCTIFWRKYSSDLGRTQQTAQLVIQDNDAWTLDARIREIAKGARQEYPKSWEYERAVEERRKTDKELPLLETSEDAWRRISEFLAEVLAEAGREASKSNSSNTPLTLNVLVVSHAGALRTLFQNMCPQADPTLQHQDDPSRPPDDGKRLAVPNTSVTILDVTPNEKFWRAQGVSKRQGRLGPDDTFFPPPGTSDDALEDIASNYNNLWDTKVIEFMWTKHLDETVTTSNDE